MDSVLTGDSFRLRRPEIDRAFLDTGNALFPHVPFHEWPVGDDGED